MLSTAQQVGLAFVMTSIALSAAAQEQFPGSQLTTLAYNNPGLVVDLGVGLWGYPIPMDYDEDGKLDILVGWGGWPYGGVRWFHRVNDDPNAILFKQGPQVSDYVRPLRSSTSNGKWYVTSPGRLYPQYRTRGIAAAMDMTLAPPKYAHGPLTMQCIYDFDGDGDGDVLASTGESDGYKGESYFDEQGVWHGPVITGRYFWVRNTGSDDQPRFEEPPLQLMAGAEPLGVRNQPPPQFADFDGDGFSDLIFNEDLDSFIFFRNVGNPDNQHFAAALPLTHDGQIIRMDLEMVTPSCGDYDGDGDIDLIVGEEDGRVSLMRNTGKSAGGIPVFELPVFLQQEAVDVKFGVLPTPFAYDLDGDGDKDLVSGNTAGYIGFIENLGGRPLRWNKPAYLQSEGQPIRILAGENGSTQGPGEAKWGYTTVSVADWDGDDLPDLIVDSVWGKVVWYRNLGPRSKPTFAPAAPIEVQWDGPNPKVPWYWWNPQGNELTVPWRTSVQAIDLNADGLCDLVALDVDGYLVLYERKQVNGKIVLLPGQRIFHMVKDQSNVYDYNQNPLFFDEDKDGRNDLAVLDADGKLPFQIRPRINGKTVNALGPRIDRRDDPRYQDPANLTALRLTAGWAGRGGRRKFLLADWDHDGKLDLFVNSLNINYLHNESQDPDGFVFRDMGQVDSLRLSGHTACPAMLDINADGVDDLVFGAEDGRFFCLPNPNGKKAN